MNPESFKGNIRWSFTAADAVNVGPGTPREQPRSRNSNTTAHGERSKFGWTSNDSATYRDVIVELLDGIAATDGARLKPWKLTFAFGAQ